MRRAVILLAVLLAVGCDGGPADTAEPGPEMLPGFDPPTPESGEIQIVSPIVEGIAPGSDITLCHYIDFETDQVYDIVDYHGFQSTFGHHVILYQVVNRQPPGTHVCTEQDMANSRYLAAGGSESGRAELPEGIVLRVDAGAQLLIQTHWINTSDSPASGQAAFNVKWGPSSPDNVVADLFTIHTSDIDLQPKSTGSARAECVMQREMQFFSLGGHQHWRGSHVSITHTPAGGEPRMIYDVDWSPHFESDAPRNSYTREEPFVAAAGDKFTIDCQYANTDDRRVRFPEEMCVMFGFYFPAERELICGDGRWPQE
jgi:hypothetical protein